MSTDDEHLDIEEENIDSINQLLLTNLNCKYLSIKAQKFSSFEGIERFNNLNSIVLDVRDSKGCDFQRLNSLTSLFSLRIICQEDIDCDLSNNQNLNYLVIYSRDGIINLNISAVDNLKTLLILGRCNLTVNSRLDNLICLECYFCQDLDISNFPNLISITIYDKFTNFSLQTNLYRMSIEYFRPTNQNISFQEIKLTHYRNRVKKSTQEVNNYQLKIKISLLWQNFFYQAKRNEFNRFSFLSQ